MDTDGRHDKVTVGLTASGMADLQTVMETKWFENEVDAYRTAIGVALGHGLGPLTQSLSRTRTKFNVGTLDKDGKLRDLVRTLTGIADRPYEQAERLAEAGLGIMAKRLASEGVLLSDVLRTVAER